jgi:hypothetical protein
MALSPTLAPARLRRLPLALLTRRAARFCYLVTLSQLERVKAHQVTVRPAPFDHLVDYQVNRFLTV